MVNRVGRLFTGTHPNSSVGRGLYCLQQLVVCMTPGKGEGGVHNPPFDMDAKVNFEYVLLFEDCIVLREHVQRLRCRLANSVAPIWAVMSGAVVQAEARRETNATFQSVLLHESSCAILDVFGDLSHGPPRLDELSCGLSNLSVGLCCPSDVIVGDFRIFHGHALIVAFLFRGSSPRVTAGALRMRLDRRGSEFSLVFVLADLTGRVHSAWEKLRKTDSWRVRLGCLLLLGLLLFLLFLCTVCSRSENRIGSCLNEELTRPKGYSWFIFFLVLVLFLRGYLFVLEFFPRHSCHKARSITKPRSVRGLLFLVNGSRAQQSLDFFPPSPPPKINGTRATAQESYPRIAAGLLSCSHH